MKLIKKKHFNNFSFCHVNFHLDNKTRNIYMNNHFCYYSFKEVTFFNPEIDIWALFILLCPSIIYWTKFIHIQIIFPFICISLFYSFLCSLTYFCLFLLAYVMLEEYFYKRISWRRIFFLFLIEVEKKTYRKNPMKLTLKEYFLQNPNTTKFHQSIYLNYDAKASKSVKLKSRPSWQCFEKAHFFFLSLIFFLIYKHCRHSGYL